MRSICLGLVALLAAAYVNPAVAGKLSGARDEVRGNDNDDSESNNDRRRGKLSSARDEVRREPRRERDRGHERRGGNRGGGAPFFSFRSCPPPVVCCPPPVESVVYVPAPAQASEPVIFESTSSGYGSPGFAAYPYADGADGCFSSTGGRKWWSGQVTFEGGDGGEEVGRTNFALQLEESTGFGVDFDLDSLTEELPGGGHDELHLGQVNLLYRVIETDAALVRVGGGVGWFDDRYGAEAGVNVTLKADLFPVQPLVISSEVDLGKLGDAQTTHAAITAGLMLDRLELYGGYDYRRIGDVEIEGPMVGVRLWW